MATLFFPFRISADIYRLILSIIFFLVCFATSVFAADVCRTDEFEGMHENKLRAERLLSNIPDGSNTKDIFKAVVYVEYTKDGLLYYHSNFISSPDRGDDGIPFRPTKVKGDPKKNKVFSSFEEVFRNIIGDKEFADQHSALIKDALKNHVKILLDISVFNNEGMPRIDIGEVSNINIVDMDVPKKNIFSQLKEKNSGNHQTSYASVMKDGYVGDAHPLITSKPPPSIIAKIEGCCLFGRPPHKVLGYSMQLSNARFDKKKLKVASFFIDSSTEEAFSNSPKLKAARLKGDAVALKTEADLMKLLDDAKGSTLVLLTHVEGQDYVVRNNSNEEQLRIPIKKVRSAALEKGISLIDIGCETTKAITEESFGFGVMTRYNSLDAIQSLERAVTNAKTHRDFLENISSEGLKVVIDPAYFKNNIRTENATVYSRIKRRTQNVWISVARISITDAPLAWHERVWRSANDFVLSIWKE